MGSPPLYNISEIEYLKGWMLSQQKITLHDISDWNEDGSWKCWELGDLPPHLHHQAHLLVKTLKGETSSKTSRTTKGGALQVIQRKKVIKFS
jgi:hypothetical protein